MSGSVAGQKGQPTVTANAVVSVQPIALTRKGNKEPTYTAQRLPCNPESVLTPQMGPRRRPPRPVGHLLVFMKFSWLFYDFFRPFRVRSIVEAKNDMSLALKRVLAPAPGFPRPPAIVETESRLNVAVIFTSVQSTLAALKKAGALANRLSGRITLVVPQVVPYPLPLTSPPVLVDWNEKRFRVIAGQSPVETTVQIYLCRDRLETLTAVLSPRSLVVVGGPKRWWPTAEKRLARTLRRAGHEVIFTETEIGRAHV